MIKNTSKQTNYNSIDLVKFIMAFAVIAIHTHPLEFCQNEIILSIYTNIIEMAVPFFFLASGFFLEKKSKEPWDSGVIYSQLIKVLKMYLLWMAIYTPLSIHHGFSQHETIKDWCLKFMQGLFFVGEQYNSWHLWYLLSTIYALLLIMALMKRGISRKGLLLVSISFAFLSIGIDTFVTVAQGIEHLPLPLKLAQGILNRSIVSGRIFSGMVFIPLGMYLARNKLNMAANIVLFSVSFVMRCVINNVAVDALLLIGVSIGFWGIIENYALGQSPIYSRLRKASTVIYLVHMYVWTFYYFFVYGEMTYGIDSFVMTSVLSCVIALFCLYAAKPKDIKEN